MSQQRRLNWPAELPPGWPEASDWTPILRPLFADQTFRSLESFVQAERCRGEVYPAEENVFRAFSECGFAQTRVVILGQDPYHGSGQAHGLSFSVPVGVKIPPSLRNIFRELHDDLGCGIPDAGDLTNWAQQGVLLLNTVLTVNQGQAHSHQRQGWEWFTDSVIDLLNEKTKPVVFVLWGKPAEKKRARIRSPHEVLISAHPSPLSAHRGFIGSRPFSKINQRLRDSGQRPINWCLENDLRDG